MLYPFTNKTTDRPQIVLQSFMYMQHNNNPFSIVFIHNYKRIILKSNEFNNKNHLWRIGVIQANLTKGRNLIVQSPVHLHNA